MRLQNNINLEQFFDAVRKCRGEVRYISDENDVLNLKSRLCLFVFTAMSGNGEPIRGRVECDETSDYKTLKDFLSEE